MKRMDLFCASPASTAICSSMDQRAIVHHRTRPISRHSHLSGDPKKTLNTVPCISQLPIDPKPYNIYRRSRTYSAKQSEIRRKSSADIGDLATPPGSSRYLLSDTPFFEVLSDTDHVKALVPTQKTRPPHIISDKTLPLKSLSTGSRPREQVVELRVSIHCKGCEGKIRKHISRMEGVTSFNIDLPTKKVTVIGDVTPLGVLKSISRVKSAQFWPSPTSSSSSSTPKLGLNY